jgi:EmrB/QacA subfamily drug resistance transporter
MSATAAPARPAAPAHYYDLPRRALVLTVIGLLLTLLLSALDQTIVGTAMPRIIAELHGFDHYAWVTTAYLLTSTASVPIVGKLGDTYGRKPFLIGGAAGFVLASALCGLSQDMTQLIVFRGLQGVAGGVLTATVFTVVSSIFPPAQRGRIQGVFSGTFGFASVIGPLLGGYLTDTLSWRWVFYVNLPVGLVALAVLWTSFPNIAPSGRRKPIDYLGAATLVLAVVPLLLALSWGGQQYPWASPPVLGLLALFAVMTVAFVWVEAHATDPIMPLGLFKNPIVRVSSASLAIMSIGMFGAIMYVPLFIQGVVGSSATNSGTLLTPMMITMIGGSMVSGQLISRTGHYKPIGVLGLSVCAVGMLLLSGMGPDTTYGVMVRNMMIVGIGLGPVMPVFTLAAQNAVRYEQLGVVTSLTQFARSIGGTLGVALFGAVLAGGYAPLFGDALSPQLQASVPAELLDQFRNPQVLLNPNAAASLQQAFASLGPQGAALWSGVLDAVRVALAGSLHAVFLAAAVIMAAGAVMTVFLKEIPLRKSFAPATTPGQAAQRGAGLSVQSG